MKRQQLKIENSKLGHGPRKRELGHKSTIFSLSKIQKKSRFIAKSNLLN
jgi:hypothetical protein